MSLVSNLVGMEFDGAQILPRLSGDKTVYDVLVAPERWASVTEGFKRNNVPHRIKAKPDGRNYGWIVAA